MAVLSTAPLLAALLGGALPGLAVLDLAALGAGGLYPWLPEARCGLPATAQGPAAERAMLARARQAGAPLFGCDPAGDAALRAGAWPGAGGEAGHRLVVLPAEAPVAPWLAAGVMVLVGAPAPGEGGAGEAGAREAGAGERVMLLLGAPAPVEPWDLRLPAGRADAVLPGLAAAARDLAGAAGQWGVRPISPRLAALTLLAAGGPAPCARLPADRLVLEEAAGGQRRIILGRLPARPVRLRLLLPPGAAPAALLLDGRRAEGRFHPDPPRLEVPLDPGPWPVVLGLAGGAAPEAVEILPP